MSSIAERIYYLRIKNELSKSAFGKKLGGSHTMVAKWENGKTIPAGPQLIKIFEVFHVEPNFILLGLEPKKSQ